jgi:hypothetical protein
VDEVCAHLLTEFELKKHMENILVKSTENSIRQLALQIQMTPEISWLTVKRLVSRFDDTALGQERLAEKGGADNLMVIKVNPPLMCEFCHKPGHTKDSCWTADPSKTPQWFREGKPPPRPGKKPKFEFSKADDDMSTLWDMSAAYKAWDDQNLFDDFSPLEQVTYCMDFIVVDTGASNLLLLL